MAGLPVMAGDKQVGTLGSTANGRGLALLRIDRADEAISGGIALTAGGVAIRPIKPSWAKFAFPGEAKSG
jgi:hypothetical protein